MSRAVESGKVLHESGALLAALERTLAELREFTAELRAELIVNHEDGTDA
ncbi:MAG TPA: hypothetical protein VFX53_17165 [Pedococcus sp.]|nr:hypothetical protein [Pedococcus sp.]